MSWPLLGILSIIGVIFLRLFHKQIMNKNYQVDALYVDQKSYLLKDDPKIFKKLLTQKKDASHFSELITALTVLSQEESVFPDSHSLGAVEQLLQALPRQPAFEIISGISILPFNQQRGYGGIEKMFNNEGSRTYVIGHINDILKIVKNSVDRDEIKRLDQRFKQEGGTNIAIAVHENDSRDRNILRDGINKKLDLIGCLYTSPKN